MRTDEPKMPIVRKTNLISIIIINIIAVGLSSYLNKNDYMHVIYHVFIACFVMAAIVLMIENIRYNSLIDNSNINSYEGIKRAVLIVAVLFVVSGFVPSFCIPWLIIPFVLYDSCRFELTLVMSLYYGLFMGLTAGIDIETVISGSLLIMSGTIIAGCGKKNLKAALFVLIFSSVSCNFIGYALVIGLPGVLTVFFILGVSVIYSFISIYLLKSQKVLTKEVKRPEREKEAFDYSAETVDYLSYIDDRYSLVKDIRNFSLAEYNHARNLSRIASSLIEEIGGDVDLTKMAGFYYRLGILQGEPVIENSIKLAYDYCFPQKVISILEEHDGTDRLPQTKESACIHMTDMCLKKAELLRSKKLSSNWNQDMVIYQTLNELSSTGIYDESGISMNQFLKIRDKLVEEGLRV